MFEPKDFFSAEEYSIKGLLTQEEKIFSIPDYQRNFAWTNNELEQFWDDLKAVVNSSYDTLNYTLKTVKPHFFGTILLTKEGSNYEVTDGQQRLTASTILLKCFYDASLRVTNPQDRSGIGTLLTPLYLKSTYDEPFEPRLKLDSTVNNFFEDYILKLDNEVDREAYLNLRPITIPHSASKRLKEAHDYFVNRMDEEFPKEMLQEELIAKLKCFIRSFTRFFVVLQLTVNQSDTAYKIFGTINNRGLDLTDSDIIKNELFMSVVPSQREQIKERWDSIIESIENEDLTDFLRFQYSSSIGAVKRVDLYDAVQKYIQGNNSITYLENLVIESDWYARVTLVNRNHWPTDITEKLRFIKESLDISHGIPLLLTGSIIYNQDVDSFRRLVNATLVFCFRYFTIGKNTVAHLEREIGFMARQLRNPIDISLLSQQEIDVLPKHKLIIDLDSLIVYMESITDNSTFKRKFKEFSTKSSPLAYYILCELEKFYLTGVVPLPHGLAQHVEHIMPKKPSKALNRLTEWEHVRSSADYKEYVYRLGNIMILESNINQMVANHPFSEKKTKFLNSGLYYPKIVSKEKEWNFNTIVTRQEIMAEKAIEVWKYV